MFRQELLGKLLKYTPVRYFLPMIRTGKLGRPDAEFIPEPNSVVSQIWAAFRNQLFMNIIHCCHGPLHPVPKLNHVKVFGHFTRHQKLS